MEGEASPVTRDGRVSLTVGSALSLPGPGTSWRPPPSPALGIRPRPSPLPPPQAGFARWRRFRKRPWRARGQRDRRRRKLQGPSRLVSLSGSHRLPSARALVAEENVRGVLTLNEEYETRFLCCSAQLYQWSPQEAIEAIARIRPHILVRPRQVQILERFHRNVIAEAAAESQQELPETIQLLPTTRTSS
ncbi:phosphatidylglycerophosphatase and protein-tyrosine phosphatase 1 isoform X4 [Chelonia mydas]|uniref:phosphatidylglycerophosphatase and protein-tyrosine phosphatase 1 isoform X4 n=1 Tax=Chelonia mydas TaxID=8469 RepID=UPI001CA87584|nr:phosphatidylglycerophosphatase and protein-tyrosine phosphatase 1 isoform X4 [Chelonia mydas]